MGLISECAGVFEFLKEFFFLLPTAVRILVYGAFGGAIYIAVMKLVNS